MKIRHLAVVAAIFLFASGNSLAQSNWTNTNNNNASFSSGTFSMSTSNMNISQSNANTSDSDSFCQFFSFSFGLMKIVQIIQGNSFSQVTVSSSDPVEDPCL